MTTQPAIRVTDLDFRYAPDAPLALRQVRLQVHPGERCVLVGENGAGKTTLLRILAGRHLIRPEAVQVLGRPAFHDTSLAGEVVLLGGPFPFEVDVRVGDMLGMAGPVPGPLWGGASPECGAPRATSVPGPLRGGAAPESGAPDRVRRENLIHILGVDLQWRMHRISDGQRRRVQLLMGLLRPGRVLLLDEVTTDLDLLGRADLLAFLRRESEQAGACILYATHIFDRLERWATHIALIHRGTVLLKQPLAQALSGQPLSDVVEGWMRRGAP